MIIPGQTNIVTYIVNLANGSRNPEKVNELTDVLPQDGFQYCSPSLPPPTGTCDAPMTKATDTPFNPATDSFTDLTGFSVWFEPTLTYDATADRWTAQWLPSPAPQVGKDGDSDDTLIIRFQTYITPSTSGAYYNEVFIDSSCPNPPNALGNEGIVKAEYCAMYSWPSGGVLVPTYDVLAETPRFRGYGNVIVDWGGPLPTGQLQSWHVNPG